MNEEYYKEKLSANKLKLCYEIASTRIQQYLEAEIQYVLDHINFSDVVLELGCGYGRVLKRLVKKARKVYGIDNSKESLDLAAAYLGEITNVSLLPMNAKSLTFEDHSFDVVFAIQNGISAFRIDPVVLVKESMRVTKVGGKVLLSSYSDKLWRDRLEWFEAQSKQNLLGEIDYSQTGDGVIVCKDGFRANTFSIEDFQKIVENLDLVAEIEEVDDSSIFCEIKVKA